MPSPHRQSSTSKRPAPLGLPGVSARPAWQGTLRLSLVSCAVGLYRATSKAGEVSFHLINPDTGNRIKMVTTDPDTGPVERSHLVKGFEVDKDNYVLFNDEELKSVKLETTRTLDIERFVDAIQQAMIAAGKIALGRVTMHTRERLLAIEPRDNGLLATTLRMRDEVVNTAEALDAIPHGKADKKMIAIAQQIIGQQEGPFDPEEFTDRYEDALHEMIEEKKKGHKIKAAPKPAEGNVIDLMDALKRSLGGRQKTSTVKKKPAKKTASRR
jgi:DNA end-binding protein Ku